MKILRRITIWLLATAFLLIIASAVLVVMEITVDLSAARPTLEAAASHALGRRVRIAGHIKLTPALFSSIEVTEVELGEVSSADALGMARLRLARLSVAVIPLLRGRVQLQHVVADGVFVQLGERFLVGRGPEASPEQSVVNTAERGDATVVFEELVDLRLRDVEIDMPHPNAIMERLDIRFSELEGSAVRGRALSLRGTGSIQGQPLTIAAGGGSLGDLFQLRLRWPVNFEATLGKTSLKLSQAGSVSPPGGPESSQGEADARGPSATLDYRFSLEGERLDELDRLVGVSLPPLGPYAAAGRFQVTPERMAVYELKIRVRESNLGGDLTWVDTAEPQKIRVKLQSAKLQLDDFEVGDWSAYSGGAAPAADQSTTSGEDRDSDEPKPILDPALMRAVEVDLILELNDVLSGPEQWGSARVGIKASDGQVDIDPLHVELPQGAIDLTATLEPIEHESWTEAHLWPTKVSGEAGGLRIELKRVLDGANARVEQVRGPGGAKLLEYELEAGGENLADLSDLAEVSLPPWGPYSLRGRLVAFENRYDIVGLALRAGESDLTGNFSLQLGSSVPRLEIELQTKTLQLDDFEGGDWSPVSESTRDQTGSKASSGADAAVDGSDVESLMSRETLERADGVLSLRVEKVLSGKDNLGGGELKLTLDKARLTMDPFRLDIPGGAVKMTAHYEPGETDFVAGIDVHVDRFDYGVLARRIDPDIDQSGKVSLDIDIDTRARDLDGLLASATGRFDFAVWPTTIEADVFDLWAVNLFTAVNSSVDKSQSKVNCVVGVFDVNDGLMKSQVIFADTTRMQVKGEAEVNFKTGEIALRAKPRPKKAEFFSAATPVEAKGNIEDFQVALPPGALVGTVTRMASSILTTPLARLIEKPLPEDGTAACADAFQRDS